MAKLKPGTKPHGYKHRTGEVGDPPEVIAMCLNCTRPTCINCVDLKMDYKNLRASRLPRERRREFIQLYLECGSDKELSQRFGRATSFVCEARHVLDLPAYRYSTLDQRQIFAEKALNELST